MSESTASARADGVARSLATTTGGLLLDAVERFSDGVAMRTREPGEWVDLDWFEVRDLVHEIAAGLADLGITKGDRVAILSNSRLEWAIADLAILTLGAIVVPVYQSNTPEEVRYVLDHSGARLVFVEDREQLGKVHEVRTQLPGLEFAVLVDGKVKIEDFLVSWKRLRERGEQLLSREPGLVLERLSAVDVDDDATIVYTSGTTGPPKGAVLTHRNLVFEAGALEAALDVTERDETLLFLPLAHIFGRVGFLGMLQLGYTVSFAESIDRLMDNLVEIRPTFVFSVPRIYEKVYDRILGRVRSGSRIKKQIFAFAMAVGRAVSRRLQAGRWIPPHLSIGFQVAELLVFNSLRRAFGGEVRFFISGGAPLAVEIAEFFHAAGMTVLEGYGLTEVTAASHLNRLDAYGFGTVGPALPGVEVRVAEDGEVLLRGDNVFRGYYRREDATAEAMEGGWFHTGDIGEIEERGFLRITDRKKDLIVTSGGKNIAPQNIENLVKTDPFISQIMVYGDKRNYLVALITLDPDELRSYAEHKGIDLEDHAELCRHPVVIARIERVVHERNKRLASYETIKKFAIIGKDFEIGDELTPTLKIRRKVVTATYRDLLEGLYA